MNLSPSNRPQQRLRIQNSLKTIAGGILLAGILQLTTTKSNYYNDGAIVISQYEINVIGIDMLNDIGGEFINNGQTYYREGIVNESIMTCGDCTSGANYISNSFDFQQSIEGSEAIKWYDGILDNSGGLLLENELQVTNSFTFTDGMIETDREDKSQFLHFLSGAVSSNASVTRHVNGYAGKTGSDPFLIPIGDDDRYLPVGINGTSESDFFKAAYFSNDPNDSNSSLGGPFNREEYDRTEIQHVPAIGFWDISGTGTTSLSLHWDDAMNLSEWIQNLDTLAVIGWDGTKWVNLGNNVTNGTLSAGYITSDAVIPDNYQAFALGKAEMTPFPVEWLSFTARLEGSDGLLEWATAMEQNAQYFEVQRSLDGLIFENIGETPAVGNTTQAQEYDFTDEGIAVSNLSKVYYRIKEVDFDGVFQYSNVVVLTLDNYVPSISMNIFPNPTSNFLNINLSGPRDRTFQVHIINNLGQTVHTGTMNGASEQRLSVTPWTSGIYHVIVQDEELKTSKQLIISR